MSVNPEIAKIIARGLRSRAEMKESSFNVELDLYLAEQKKDLTDAFKALEASEVKAEPKKKTTKVKVTEVKPE